MYKLESLLFLACAVAACGGTGRAPVAPPANETHASSPSAGDVQAEKQDAAASPHLIMTVRLAHPETTMQSVLSTFPRDIPPMARDVRKFLKMGVGKISEYVALDKPMDFYVFQRSFLNPAVVLTAVLRDDINARAELGRFRLTEMPEGRLEVKPPNPFSTDLGAAKECEVDEAAHTITCANADGFVARTRAQRPARATPSAELWVEMDREPIREQILKDERRERSAGVAIEAGRDLGQTLARSLFDDLRSVESAANLSHDAATVSFTLNLIQGRSLLARVIGSTAPAGPPPARFFRLPVDSEMAFFSGGVDAGVWEPIKKEFVDAVVADVTKETEYPESILNEGRQTLRQLFFTGGPWMMALGSRPSAYRDVMSDRVARSPADNRKMSVNRTVKQWFILEVDEPGEKVVAQAKQFLDFSHRADLYGRAKPRSPSAAKTPENDEGKWKPQLAAIPPSFPRATLHVVSRSTKFEKLRGDKVIETPHLFVVPEGDHAWIGYGEDEKTVVEHLKRVLEGEPKKGTLAALPGIELLSSMSPLTGGGLFSLKLLVDEPKDTSKAQSNALDEKLKYIDAVPSKGSAPYFFGIRRGTDAAPQVTIEAKSSTRSLQELVGYLRLDDSK